MTQEVIRKINPNAVIKQGAITYAQVPSSGTYLDRAKTYDSVEGFDDKLEKSFNEYGVYWDDMRIAGTSFLNGATAPSVSQYQGSIYLPAYAAAATIDQAFATVQFPHGWKIGTNFRPHIHWSPSVGGGVYDNQGVCWKIDYSIAPRPGTFIAPVTMSGVDTWTTGSDGLVQYGHRRVRFMDSNGSTEIGVSGLTISSMILLRLYRDNAHTADTFTQPAHFLEVDFHYQIDKPGSREELTK